MILFIYACPSGEEESERRERKKNRKKKSKNSSDKMETFSKITFQY